MNQLLAHLLDAASRAPSAHNTQPWILTWRDDALHISLKPDRLLSAVDATNADAFHAVGALLENLMLTLEQLRLQGHYQVADRLELGQPLVKLTWKPSNQPPKDATLYRMIPIRRTSRIAYKSDPVAADILQSLSAVTGPQSTLRVINDLERVEEIRQLVADATLEQLHDPSITSELYDWLRFSRRNRRWFRDGLNAECMCWKRWQTVMARRLLTPRMIRALTWCRLNRVMYGSVDQNAPAAPVICLLTLESDNLQSRVEAGRSLQRVWLTAASHGLVTHPISAAVDVARTRPLVYQLFDVPPGHVHVNLFRLGYSDPVARSHRLPVDEILTAVLPIPS